jgi:hypothetical protein
VLDRAADDPANVFLGIGQGLDNVGNASVGLHCSRIHTVIGPVCTENLIRVDAAMESPELAE